MKTLYELITVKRDGGELQASEIQWLVEQYTRAKVTDYQMSAFLMAAFIRGLSPEETSALTAAMLKSGTTVAVKGLDRPLIDKHSTGGVGDKLSLTLSPLLADCGIAVGMFSGRGLGHTGGTLDKLEAIPGMKVFHSSATFGRLLKRHRFAITGQTARIAPADKKIYALRDATGTVESIPLIVASIMSKKLALKSDGIVFDVKSGAGAFMKRQEDALALAKALVEVARAHSLPARAVITNMDQPTGRMIGNWLEVIETVEVLKGGGPADTVALTLELGSQMLKVAGLSDSACSIQGGMSEQLRSGESYESFCRYVKACGGDTKTLERAEQRQERAHKVVVESPASGYISALDAGRLGFLAVKLGAGRRAVADKIDYLAGIELHAKIGGQVSAGQPLATGYASRSAKLADFEEKFLTCIRITSAPPERPRLVLARL